MEAAHQDVRKTRMIRYRPGPMVFEIIRLILTETDDRIRLTLMNTTSSATVRTATIADAESLAALAQRTFRDAFAAGNASTDIDTYVREALSLDRLLTEMADEANTFLLAIVDGEEQPVGYAKLRNGVADPCVSGPKPVELERIYVDRHAIGSGVGALLMNASLDAASAAGHRTLWLGVWEHNAGAIAFYRRWGFETVGDHVFQLGSEAQCDLIMQRPVPGET
jgi:ribosomal protein S18 acetylase RimI-like enzyme